jgi:hypothetical protein
VGGRHLEVEESQGGALDYLIHHVLREILDAKLELQSRILLDLRN